jgi:hypothetical protein
MVRGLADLLVHIRSTKWSSYPSLGVDGIELWNILYLRALHPCTEIQHGCRGILCPYMLKYIMHIKKKDSSLCSMNKF